ncbi:Y-family DNA polymerase [Metamycoplasma salivarium]|uniref:DNA polymerase IV n=2 Tax=Metamycoplasma salivarium TaxID=2124 RepID=A0A448ZZI1_METSV|nr:DNA polymerase IV [Metamycoplasma salivarium]CAD7361451.1 DNA polymerase IV [Metamycoplasma salivarium]VEU56647.1 DNA polymerase IV [Metamycoplasma salivarium]
MIEYIFHIDMDTYFVSCERYLEPKLVGKPIAIANEYKRSIAAAISNELKQMGFKSGDSIQIIKQKVKDLVIVHPNYNLYTLISSHIFNFLREKYSRKLEIFSIDECYLQIQLENDQNPVAFAMKIQDDIFQKFHIPCSIGISFTKFLAKMSTNLAKPHGVRWTQNKKDIRKNFYSLDISRVFGIGKASSKKLKEIGISTYEDLLNFNNERLLRNIFGKNYLNVLLQMKGEKTNDVLIASSNMKGMGNQETFLFDDVQNYSILIQKIKDISYFISSRLKFHNYEGNVITIQFRNINKHWVSFQTKINEYVNDAETITNIALKLFDKHWNEEPLRGIGIRVSNLRLIFNQNNFIDLFTNLEQDNIKSIIFSINQHLGKNSLKTLSDLKLDKKAKSKGIKFIKEDVMLQKNNGKEYK